MCSQQSRHGFHGVPAKLDCGQPRQNPTFILHNIVPRSYLDIKHRGLFIRERRERDRKRAHELGNSEHCGRSRGDGTRGAMHRGRDTLLFQQPGAAAGIQRTKEDHRSPKDHVLRVCSFKQLSILAVRRDGLTLNESAARTMLGLGWDRTLVCAHALPSPVRHPFAVGHTRTRMYGWVRNTHVSARCMVYW